MGVALLLLLLLLDVSSTLVFFTSTPTDSSNSALHFRIHNDHLELCSASSFSPSENACKADSFGFSLQALAHQTPCSCAVSLTSSVSFFLHHFCLARPIYYNRALCSVIPKCAKWRYGYKPKQERKFAFRIGISPPQRIFTTLKR